jgi:hypothetical protein
MLSCNFGPREAGWESGVFDHPPEPLANIPQRLTLEDVV